MVYVLLVCPAMAVPPVDTVYQRYCPAVPPEADKVRLAVVQEKFPVTEGAAGAVLMVAVTAVRVPSHVPLLMAT